jgi:hypothetical protein
MQPIDYFFTWFDTWISFKDLTLIILSSFEMYQQQTYMEQNPTLGAHTHGFWVGMGAMLLFMGGHGWA